MSLRRGARLAIVLIPLGLLPAGPMRAVALVTTCADSGAGSLRAAITATSGGTIRFQAG